MAKHLDKFTKPFQNSRIPFFLAELRTNGSGEMVDLLFRFVNAPAAALLNVPVEELTGRRLTHVLPSYRLGDLAPLQTVAFSGSAASFAWPTAVGQLHVTCYQPMYGMAACIMEPQYEMGQDPAPLLAKYLPGAVMALELSRNGVRCLSFSQKLCSLTGRPRQELLNRCSADVSSLIDPADWPGLLQDLLDAARERRSISRDLRLQRADGLPLWVSFQAEILPSQGPSTVFYTVLLDVDRQRRTLAALAEAQAKQEAGRAEFAALFVQLPGNFCVFQAETEGSSPRPLHLSQGLISLLGHPEEELLHCLTADPLWYARPEDRKPLLRAFAACADGAALHHILHVQCADGPISLTLDAVSHRRPDGGRLLYALCSDAAREEQALSSLQFHAQLNELLLDRSRTLTFDYDPALDLAHVQYLDPAGHRATRVISGYLDALPYAKRLHPEDRKRTVASLRRAFTAPTPESPRYRADYDGQGWRWYQVSWARLLDGDGNVRRLLGKAEEIDHLLASAQRFRELSAQQKKPPRGLLLSARLDLTEDRILDAKGSAPVLRVLFGDTADISLCHLRDCVPDAEQRQRFDGLFRRGALLERSHRGTLHASLEHRFRLEGAASGWGKTTLELVEDPELRHLNAFLTMEDVTAQRQKSAVLDALALRDYEAVLTVDAATGACQVCGPLADVVSPGVKYRALVDRYLRDQAPFHGRTAFRQAVRLETVLAALETEALYTVTDTQDTPEGPRTREVRWSWLDQEGGTLLATLRIL